MGKESLLGMDDEPRKHRLALDDEPDIAREIGLILSAFAILELSPPHILAKVTGMQKDDADITLGHFRNFSNRLDLIQAIAGSRIATDPVAKEALSMITDIRACVAIRNKYAHGLWTGTQVGLQLSSWLTDATRNSVAVIVTHNSIQEDCAFLRATLHKAIVYSQIVVPPVRLKESKSSTAKR